MSELTKDTLFQILTAFREESLRKYLQQDELYDTLADRVDAAEAAVERLEIPEEMHRVIRAMGEAKQEVCERELTISYLAGIGDCLDFLRKHKFLEATILDKE